LRINNGQIILLMEELFSTMDHIWGTICDKNLNQTSAEVFCNSLNPQYSAVSWITLGSLPYNI